MEEVTCFIMDNLLGRDFMSIDRIYDLKGSTKGRTAKLLDLEEEGKVSTGMKVLKDLNFINFNERLDV
jgi:Phosphatidylinositol-4-phosphate 5-Kinase